jgi:SAM-dependent methyltransferase
MRPYNDNAGDWEGLDSVEQAPRYAAIVELLCAFQAELKVLDVGCGEGVLRSWLPMDTNYTGIERSSLATQKAIERDASARIIHTSAESFDPCGERFASIVFNEMLYYAADPVGLLQRYSRWLWHGGVMLCSIYQKPGPVSLKRRLWHLLDHRRPISNIHCTDMVRDFMAHERWPILNDRVVAIPGTAAQWHIWLARPYSGNDENSQTSC